MFKVWWGICTWLCYKFPTESISERILKISQYLVKLWARVKCLVFLLTVYIGAQSYGVVACLIGSWDCAGICVRDRPALHQRARWTLSLRTRWTHHLHTHTHTHGTNLYTQRRSNMQYSWKLTTISWISAAVDFNSCVSTRQISCQLVEA